jgi:hypothetical protein
MQAQGTDALSRGDLLTGVMRDRNMLQFIPLHLTARDRSPSVATWVSSWISPGHTLHSLTPVEWFTVGQGYWGGSANPDGIWTPDSSSAQHLVRLWLPPPAAADVAVEQLSFSRHKRPDLIHVFICPHLMTQHWRKRLYKISDVLFNIPVGAQEDFGRLICMSLWWWVSFCPFCLFLPGSAGTPHQFWTWSANCGACGRRLKGTQGIFCANFGFNRGGVNQFVFELGAVLVIGPIP